MSKIISVANQKGGVGKSTTAHALGIGLKGRGSKVLFVDLDPQGNLSYTMEAQAGLPSAYEMMTHRAEPADCVQHLPQGDLIAGGGMLSSADMELNQTGKEFRLREGLTQLRDSYDYIVIDTPPALGVLTVNALAASDWLLIPAQADIYSLQGIGQLYATIDAVRTYCNPELKISGILLTRHNNRAVLSRDLTDLIIDTARQFDARVYSTVIRECIALKEAQASCTDIFSYGPKSNAAIDYEEFLDEFLRGVS